NKYSLNTTKSLFFWLIDVISNFICPSVLIKNINARMKVDSRNHLGVVFSCKKFFEVKLIQG
ncbi:MAG: hypothetical protein J6586_08510, partial [Snodgrassella sp.]|nr:hypothetical protein [Snodgrassella sp.]